MPSSDKPCHLLINHAIFCVLINHTISCHIIGLPSTLGSAPSSNDPSALRPAELFTCSAKQTERHGLPYGSFRCVCVYIYIHICVYIYIDRYTYVCIGCMSRPQWSGGGFIVSGSLLACAFSSSCTRAALVQLVTPFNLAIEGAGQACGEGTLSTWATVPRSVCAIPRLPRGGSGAFIPRIHRSLESVPASGLTVDGLCSPSGGGGGESFGSPSPAPRDSAWPHVGRRT